MRRRCMRIMVTPYTRLWCSGLRHCISVLEASLHTLVRSRAVSLPAVIESPIGRRTTGSASSGLGEGLARVGRHCK
jgi:hypothetical protein